MLMQPCPVLVSAQQLTNLLFLCVTYVVVRELHASQHVFDLHVKTHAMPCNRAPVNKAVQALDIGYSGAVNSTLISINLEYNGIGPAGAQHIAKALDIP
eukprot:g30941.t1